MANTKISRKELQPLEITCKSADCEAGLHCFKQHKKEMMLFNKGSCVYCGVGLVDWSRIHKKNYSDIEYVFNSLKFEYYRHHYWHKEIDQKAINHALRKGRRKMKDAAEKRIRTSIGPAQPFHDGWQTGKEGNILFYAQHATATCCRKCLNYWHGIPLGRELSDGEIEYFSNLIMRFVDDRMPNLPEGPTHVPPIRRK